MSVPEGAPAEVACRICGEQVARDAARCPSCACRHPDAARFRATAPRTSSWPWLVAAAAAFAIWRAVSGD